MKIVHLCAADRFADYHSYQVNNLIKFHQNMGLEVEVIASCDTFNEKGEFVHDSPAGTYIGENNIKITRLPFKRNNKYYWKMKRFVGLYDALVLANADILFVHGGQFLDIDQVVKYVTTRPEVVVYVDNHADFSNSATNWLSKNILHKIIWRHCEHEIEPYAKKFYGVLPARVEFLKNVYNLPESKCELLVMGADDELVAAASDPKIKREIRKSHRISEDDFLIMTGGKIDRWKTQTLLLMQAVKNLECNKVKLIVFGSVAKELQNQVNELADGMKIQYIGWVQSKDSYNYFASADLVVFPGRHSVFWEQVVGQGIPMVVKDWAGTHHIDLGGNVSFLHEDSAEEIKRVLESIINDKDKYTRMKNVAMQKGMKMFSYKNISEQSIRDVLLEGSRER